ncbi:hypothetical protein ACO03V_11765 [Microbacterium sp. HMH0099]|uniref:hypothetical protein n=1 Tax=Microbacterium sp. HMH0099 TaxID=3414026 RepID=UPI003BF674E6
MKKKAITGGVGVAALALTAAFGASSAAWAADITGETTVTVDVTTAGQVEVRVWARNTSAVPAYGAAVISAPDGTLEDYGPRLFQPGEEWVWSKVLVGYGCDDVAETAAATFGFEELGTAPDWTSGVLAAPDPRVTVIGCDVSPEPSPSPTPTMEPTPTPSASPEVTATPTPAVVVPSAAPTAAASVASKPTALAATGSSADALLPAGIVAAAAVSLGLLLMVLRRRRTV